MSALGAFADGELDWSDDGCAALGGSLLARADELDRAFTDLAGRFGAAESSFPSMIATASLAPVGYLQSFPHLATFVAAARRERDTLAGIAAAAGGDADVPVPADSLATIEHLLTPAACYHFYPRLSGRRLTQPLFLTTACQCHRREEHYEPLRRQWCFRMREIVCIGSASAVAGFVADCRSQVDTFVTRLGLAADWETATDSFFDPARDPKALAQLLEPAKEELRLADGLAIASVNAHRTFFGECYDIHCNEEHAHSACVAFGIERWLYALLAAFGSNPADWPCLDMKS